MKFRGLNANEIDVRLGGNSGEDKVYFLLYKDARCDMNMLDESGYKWQRKHYECKGNLYCSVGIYDEDLKEWVWRDDCGAESYTEKEKGEASDSFKRACVNWGIGRELYTAPNIKIKRDELKFDPTGKYLWSKLRVKDIAYEEGTERTIIRLCITDGDKDVYTYGYERQKKQPEAPKCEKCQKTIVSAPSKVKGEEGKFIPASQVVATSKEITSKAGLGEHVYCPECLKKVIAEVKNGK